MYSVSLDDSPSNVNERVVTDRKIPTSKYPESPSQFSTDSPTSSCHIHIRLKETFPRYPPGAVYEEAREKQRYDKEDGGWKKGRGKNSYQHLTTTKAWRASVSSRVGGQTPLSVFDWYIPVKYVQVHVDLDLSSQIARHSKSHFLRYLE